VVESLNKVYDAQPDGNTLVFSEPKPAHEDVIRRVLSRLPIGEKQVDGTGVADDSATIAN